MSVETAEKRIALTFDDGPDPGNTPKLLDLLASKEIVATFFLVGKKVRRHGDLAVGIHRAGHHIGNHGYHHFPFTVLPNRLVVSELRRTSDAIAGATGVAPRFVRPPMGWFSTRVLELFRLARLRPVLGNVYPRDSARPGADVIARRILRNVTPGSIVILHDGGWRPRIDRSQTLEAVDRVTDVLGADGYRFDTLPGLIEAARSAKSAKE